MAELLFCDSFDHTTGSHMNRKWTSVSSSSVNPGRTGKGATVGTFDFLSKTFGTSYAAMCSGIAYKTPGFANSILRMSNVQSGVQCAVTHVGDGRLSITASTGNDTSTGTGTTPSSSAASTFVMLSNQFYYVELYASVAGSTVTVASESRLKIDISATIYINGSSILSHSFSYLYAGSPVPAIGVVKWNAITVNGPGGGLLATVDDFYVTDGEVLGDIAIYPIYPRLDGDLAQWVPSSAGNHNLMVKEATPDDDTTFVKCASTNINDIDQYYLDTLAGFSGVIKGAQALWCVKRSDAGDASIKGVYKSGGTTVLTSSPEFADGNFHPSDVAWYYHIDAKRKSPFTTLDWTTTEINGMQLGIKRTS